MSGPTPPVGPPAACEVFELVGALRRPHRCGYATPAVTQDQADREDLVEFLYLDPYDRDSWKPPREVVPIKGEDRAEKPYTGEARLKKVPRHVLNAHSAQPAAFRHDKDEGAPFPHPLRLGQADEVLAAIPAKQEHNRALWTLSSTLKAYGQLLTVSAQRQAAHLHDLATLVPWVTDDSGVALPRDQQPLAVLDLAVRVESLCQEAVQHSNTQVGVLEISTILEDFLKAKFDKSHGRAADLVIHRILTSVRQSVSATGETDAFGEVERDLSAGATKEIGRLAVNERAKEVVG